MDRLFWDSDGHLRIYLPRPTSNLYLSKIIQEKNAKESKRQNKESYDDEEPLI